MLLQAQNHESQVVWAENARQVAEVAASKMRDMGYSVSPQEVDLIAEAVTENVRTYLAAMEVRGMAESQVAPVLAAIQRRLEILGPEMIDGMKRGT